jgi:tRNA dimethylallyltransferase
MANQKSFNLLVILGPTAVGKTKLAAQLAYKFNGEIISADSRQVFRRMNIGTGKDYDDYIVNDQKIPFHLIDVVDPDEEFDLFRFLESFKSAYEDIILRGKLPVLAGGTGLYLHAVLKKYNLKKARHNVTELEQLNKLGIDALKNILLSLKPKLHNVTDLESKERMIKAISIMRETNPVLTLPDIDPIIIGINPGRDEVKKRITARLRQRLESGMIDEVKNLIDSGISIERLEFFGLEYRFISRYLTGNLSFNDMFQKLNSAIHAFAKRQMTWFRKMEREGIKINWIENPDADKATEIISNF